MFRIRDIKTNIILYLFFFNSITFALPEDHLQKIHIIADVWNYNYKTGVTIYEGNVQVDQGTTHITADRLITKCNNKHVIKEAIAYGLHKTAHYWTLPKPNDAIMHAYANVIKYYPLETNITLEQNVTVLQDKNSFQGQTILYNMNDQTITVPATENGRAVLVYNPD